MTGYDLGLLEENIFSQKENVEYIEKLINDTEDLKKDDKQEKSTNRSFIKLEDEEFFKLSEQDQKVLINHVILARALCRILTQQFSSITERLVWVGLENVEVVKDVEPCDQGFYYKVESESFEENFEENNDSENDDYEFKVINHSLIVEFSDLAGKNLLGQMEERAITRLDLRFLFEGYGKFLIKQYFENEFWLKQKEAISNILFFKNTDEIKLECNKKYIKMCLNMQINDVPDLKIVLICTM